MRKIIIFLACWLTLITITGCGGSSTNRTDDDTSNGDGSNQNSPPVTKILNPANSTTFTSGDTISFSGSSIDAEDGDLSGTSLVWISDLDGTIGTGESFSSPALSAGNHQITLTGTDSLGSVETDSISIIINVAPLTQITSPADYSIFNFGDTIAFESDCSDAEDGDLNGNSLVWSSDLDGQIGSGKTFSTDTLSLGVHLITLVATDSKGSTGSDVIDLTINLRNPIPDTGQVISYTDTFGEDADYEINAPSYTKLDSSGNELEDSATAWSMVRDNVTNLIWEVKSDDDSINDKDNIYNWQDAHDIFIDQLNSSHYGGFSDWRLPTIKELSTIVFKNTFNPAINNVYFPNTMSSCYWSSTNVTNIPYNAWVVNFNKGRVYILGKSFVYYVRAVRDGQ
jgi:hypothetical protein